MLINTSWTLGMNFYGQQHEDDLKRTLIIPVNALNIFRACKLTWHLGRIPQDRRVWIIASDNSTVFIWWFCHSLPTMQRETVLLWLQWQTNSAPAIKCFYLNRFSSPKLSWIWLNFILLQRVSTKPVYTLLTQLLKTFSLKESAIGPAWISQ